MAAFLTMAAAETRAYAKVADKTWVVAHAGRTTTGVICVRVQRFMKAPQDGALEKGAWVEITDDATV